MVKNIENILIEHIRYNDIEIWKDIPDYEGLYQISNWGQILSLIKWRKTYKRILRPSTGKYGYLIVHLFKNRQSKKFFVHRLVLGTFVGPCPDGMECCHKDGNAKNNHINNLEWNTHKENVKHQILHKTLKIPIGYQVGSRQWNSKLNELQARIIKYLLKTNYLTQNEIAKIFNVSKDTIYLIKKEKSWKHI